MKLQEVLSFLEHAEKRERLIQKLIHAGKDSKEVHAFHDIIDSFNLNKTPKGIDQIDILQNTFKFCSPFEAFRTFRLVSKTWQRAFETFRFKKFCFPLDNLGQFAQIPVSYSKFVHNFKEFKLEFDANILSKWDSISKFILAHVKKANYFEFAFEANVLAPPNFDTFLLQLFQNSQITLKKIGFEKTPQFFQCPAISLPNVTRVVFVMSEIHDHMVEDFDMFVKTLAKSCEYLEQFIIFDIEKCPNMIEHIKTHYSDKCVISNGSFVSRTMPVKMPVCPRLSHLQHFQYPRKILFLNVCVSNCEKINDNGWDNYQTLFTFAPNLQGIRLSTFKGRKWLQLQDLLNQLPEKIQEVWKKRIHYLRSRNIKIMSQSEYLSKSVELCKQTKWGFTFQ